MWNYLNQYIKNPLSTFTNIAYLVIGIMVWSNSWLLGLTFIMLFVASSGFHALRSKSWHKFDIVAIFYAFGAIAGYLWFGDVGVFFGIVVGGFGHALYDEFFGKDNRYQYYIICLGVVGLIPIILNYPLIYLYYILGCYAIAFIVSQLAERRIEENTFIYDSLHAIWHIFSALGMLYQIRPELLLLNI